MAVRIIEWHVKAHRNQTAIRLPAPEGEVEAEAIARHLAGFDWQDVEVVYSPHAAPESDTISKVWPECERCTRKHSPFNHEAEGCPHCMGICRKPNRGGRQPKAAPPVEDTVRPKGFQPGMSAKEFGDWLETAL